MSRCTGHCCHNFVISGTPDGLRASVAREEGATLVEDDAYLLDMLLPLYGPLRQGEGVESIRYTCRHFDGQNCTAYTTRPHMCRRYPSKNGCQSDGCTYNPHEATAVDVPLAALLDRTQVAARSSQARDLDVTAG